MKVAQKSQLNDGKAIQQYSKLKATFKYAKKPLPWLP